jgi:hypothetical protein
LRIADPNGGDEPSLSVGDVVRTGDNLYPQYEVVAISGDRAWIRDIQYRTDNIVPICALRKDA